MAHRDGDGWIECNCGGKPSLPAATPVGANAPSARAQAVSKSGRSKVIINLLIFNIG